MLSLQSLRNCHLKGTKERWRVDKRRQREKLNPQKWILEYWMIFRIIGKRSFDWCYLIYQRLAVHQACDPKLRNHLSSIIIVKRTSTTNRLSRRISGRPPVKHVRCWCPQLLAWYWYLWFYKGNDSNLPISRLFMAVYFWAMAIQRLRRLRVNKEIILMTARKTCVLLRMIFPRSLLILSYTYLHVLLRLQT
jgi:hypothetical protein